ncbi:MAG: hypothetical protein KQI62_02065 [Deltaproteobacteria bacterium]|nr:hypothetical protein [Deltaproteobacteria bacterium]
MKKLLSVLLAASVAILWCVPSWADDLVELGAPTLICNSKSSYQMATQLVARGNRDAVKGMVSSGRCKVYGKGRIVYLEEGHATGLVKVSVFGEAGSGYTELHNYNK